MANEDLNNARNEKKDFFDRRPFGIPKRYILGVVWLLATIATWFITQDTHKTMVVAICSPFIAGFGVFFLCMISMVGMMYLYSLNEIINEILPEKCRKIKWHIVIPLWVALPILVYIRRGDIPGALLTIILVPFMAFMLLWLFGLFGSWIIAACEVRNPILKILAIIGVLLIIGLMIANGITSKGGGHDDYDQYDRGDPTYFRRR